ncbi:MAG: TIGR03085 family metal-binding protein [Actinomycetota bacterium]|nr:TIGR03085 family metal-binding protein [Actinomycetota bacterium]
MSAEHAQAERGFLCDLMLGGGPDAPTLCEGWTAAHLAAHLCLRERRLDVGLGLVLPGPFARYTAWTTDRVAQRVPFERLVSRIRSGPPTLIRPVDGPMNLLEFFVHVEDVRRAVDGWSPREDEALQDALWPFQQSRTKLQTRRLDDVDLSIARPGQPPVYVRSGSRSVTVTGEPGELALYFFGRRDEAVVNLDGDPEGIREVSTAPIGF